MVLRRSPKSQIAMQDKKQKRMPLQRALVSGRYFASMAGGRIDRIGRSCESMVLIIGREVNCESSLRRVGSYSGWDC